MEKLLPWLRRVTALMTLLLAALLCWQCADVYADGNAAENLDENGVHRSPVYTMEDVSARLTTLAVPSVAYVLLVAVTAAVQSRVPAPAEKTRLTAENRLRLRKRRTAELPEAALREETLRRRIRLVTGAAVLLCAAMAGQFLFNGANFVSWDLENVMGELLLRVAPWAAVALLAVFAAQCACDASYVRECAALQHQPVSTPAPERAKAFPAGVLRIVLYVTAIVFIVLGVMNGGLYDVLVKAINICTECIGLG